MKDEKILKQVQDDNMKVNYELKILSERIRMYAFGGTS